MSDLDNENILLKSNIYTQIKDNSSSRKNIIFSIIILIILIFVFLIIFLLIKLLKFIFIKDEISYWKPKGDKLKTKWGQNLNARKAWTEYPRPQLERKEWLNLNGIWSYTIGRINHPKPEKIDGKILIPFPLESSLSGVMRTISDIEIIWYEKDIEIPKKWNEKKILIHFGAVDWKCELFINNIENKIGEHEGGYSPFYFDITQYLNKKGKNKIILKVLDPTNRGYQPVGKQVNYPKAIWYTSVSGIWQTVWIEPVEQYYITNLEVNNKFDNKEIKITFKLNSDILLPLNLTLEYKNKIIVKANGKSNQEISIKIPDEDFHPWSPSEPNLYNIKADLLSGKGNIYDSVLSYTAIRKIESLNDTNGYLRIYLNNEPIFNMGTLDQGYWPDGLYTPPSEEAMIFDIKKLKELGFNSIRKHLKVEPNRYYYQCDKIGMLVWQDMPSSDMRKTYLNNRKINGGKDRKRSEESKANFYHEWGDIIDNLKFFQSIIVWVQFNLAWGQFDTEKVANFTREKDPSRLIDSASGGNYRICGNFLDVHGNPSPRQHLKVNNLINIQGTYGGLKLEIKGHTWRNNLNNEEISYDKQIKENSNIYEEYINKLIEFIKTGFSAAFFIQTTDIEYELNGLLTYDREILKINGTLIKSANEKIIESLKYAI